jgi:hypothetical protein
MKKSLLFISALVAGASSFAQQIPNGNFESWTNSTTPTGWSNSFSYSIPAYSLSGSPSTTDSVSGKIGHSAISVHSVSIQNVYYAPGISISGVNAVASATITNVLATPPTTSQYVQGSFPASVIPKTLSGFARYRTAPDSSTKGGITIQLFYQGNVIGGYVNAAAAGTADSSTFPIDTVALNGGFVNFNIPITATGNLIDSIRISLSTSLPTQATKATAHDTLWVDQLRFLSCTPDTNSVSLLSGGISPKSISVVNGGSVDQVYTIATPSSTIITRHNVSYPYMGYTLTISTLSFSITSLDSTKWGQLTVPAGLTATYGTSDSTSYGGSYYCLTISGTPATTQSYSVQVSDAVYGSGKFVALPYITTPRDTTLAGGFLIPVDTLNINVTPPTPTITANGNVLTSSSSTGNQWYKDGNAINAATAQTYTVTQGGSYTDIVTIASVSSATSNPITFTATPTPTITAVGHVLTSSASTGNQWYWNGSLINGATAATYTATANGSYTVKVTITGITSAASAPSSITDFGPTAVPTVDGNVFSVLQNVPNPFSGTTTITFSAPNGGAVQFTVIDLLGRVVSSQTINASAGINTITYAAGASDSGTYFYTVSDGTHSITKKLVVTK